MPKFERYQLPDWDAPAKPTIEDVTPEEEAFEPPTAQELQAMVEAAQAEGLAQGQQQGYSEGLTKGHAEGLAKGLAEGKTQGHTEGFKQGIIDAQAQAQSELAQNLQRLEQLYASLSNARSQVDEQIEQVLVQVALQVASGLVQAELSKHKEHLERLIKQGIDALPAGADWLQIVAEPGDADWLKQHFGHPGLVMDVVVDASLSPGSCRLQTKQSLVDLTLGSRWRDQVAALLEQASITATAEQILAAPITEAEDAEPSEAPAAKPEMADDDQNQPEQDAEPEATADAELEAAETPEQPLPEPEPEPELETETKASVKAAAAPEISPDDAV